MEQERRDELEGKPKPEKSKKKVSLVEMQREKYVKRGTAIVGGIKGRKKQEDDVREKYYMLQGIQTILHIMILHTRRRFQNCLRFRKSYQLPSQTPMKERKRKKSHRVNCIIFLVASHVTTEA